MITHYVYLNLFRKSDKKGTKTLDQHSVKNKSPAIDYSQNVFTRPCTIKAWYQKVTSFYWATITSKLGNVLVKQVKNISFLLCHSLKLETAKF